jgi:hypothetical protein
MIPYGPDQLNDLSNCFYVVTSQLLSCWCVLCISKNRMLKTTKVLPGTKKMLQKSWGLMGWGLPAVLLAASMTAQAGVLVDDDLDIIVVSDVNVTISGVTNTYEVTYIPDTFENIFGPGSNALPADWPFNSLESAMAASNAIANALNGAGFGDAQFTNGISDGLGSPNGWLPFNVGQIENCGLCVESIGLHYSNGDWVSDISSTFLSLDTVTTWAIFPPSPVPEPQSYALLLSGLGLVGWAARRRIKV